MCVGRLYYSIIFRTEAREEGWREREGVAEREKERSEGKGRRYRKRDGRRKMKRKAD